MSNFIIVYLNDNQIVMYMKENLFQLHFGQIKDQRSHINKLHNINDIFCIALVSVICGAETWKQIEEFAQAKKDFLKSFLNLSNGIPSYDTFNRVISSIDTKEFEVCFINWVASGQTHLES